VERIFLTFYNIGFALLLLIVGPFLLSKKKARAGLMQKLGFLPEKFLDAVAKSKHNVWFHAVSVGEFNAVFPFIEAFHKLHPEKSIVISTTTATGNQLAIERAGHFATIFFFPFDLPYPVERAVSAIRPELVVTVETELWPYFADYCARSKIPMVVLNGRMSPRSFKSYLYLRGVFGPMFRKLTLIGAQSKVEAERYEQIAGVKLPCAILGNLKYDNISLSSESDRSTLRKLVGINDIALVLIAGSTHEGEEALVLECLKELRKTKSDARLVIAPRHPERFERVFEIIEQHGLTPRKYSKGESFESNEDVLVLDTIGALSRFYACADVAFVGGTITPNVGGHNLLEPYAYGVPVACGPHLFKTRDTARILLASDALLVGKTVQEVEKYLLDLLTDNQLRARIGENGKRWLRDNQGAVKRAIDAVEKILPIPSPIEAKQKGGESWSVLER
jgi:3-deoxy-D-manno-octulosonic-acid transferase